MTLLLIANPAAGGKRGRNRIPEIEAALKNQGVDCDILVTGYHRHAETLLRDVAIDRYDGIVSIGGDGTNYHVLNGLIKYHPDEPLPALGVIPVGSGNSFAMDLGIFSAWEGIKALVSGVTCPVDVLRFTQGKEFFYSVNLMGAGFVTDVAQTASRLKKLGDMSYVFGVIHRALNLEFYRADLYIDGKRYCEDQCLIEFCNSRYTGGKMLIAPEARIDDGLMDVVMVSKLSRRNLLATFPKIFKGTHGSNPAVRILRAREVILSTIPPKKLLPDGELFGTTPVKVTVLPGKVRYFCAEP
ncbi:MAG: diacylglycerol kinase family protein [Pseudomonadota bacterium]